jgi:integrase
MNELIPVNNSNQLLDLDHRLLQTAQQAQETMQHASAENTKKSYESDWKHFVDWCVERGVSHLPSTGGMVALYIQDLSASYKTSTIQRRMASINAKHRESGFESFSTRVEPLHSVWSGIVRKKGKKKDKKAPTLTADIQAMVNTLDDSIIGIRDRALLLIGFAGALRRSELAELNLEDLEFRPQGIFVTIQKSKTDQMGEGQSIGIPYGSTYETCPVRSLQRWLEVANISEGALFRSVDRHGNVKGRIQDNTVDRVVKKCAAAAEMDASRYGAHSLRAGLITSAALNGQTLPDIMRQSRHKSESVALGYIRVADVFTNNVAGKVGL